MKIVQNLKSGFANFKETLGILLSVDENSEGYDLYIKSNNEELSHTAQVLKNIEQEQEQKRFSLFANAPKVNRIKKKIESIEPSNNNSVTKKNITKSLQNDISKNVKLEGKEPEEK